MDKIAFRCFPWLDLITVLDFDMAKRKPSPKPPPPKCELCSGPIGNVEYRVFLESFIPPVPGWDHPDDPPSINRKHMGNICWICVFRMLQLVAKIRENKFLGRPGTCPFHHWPDLLEFRASKN